jgi:membrane-associated phospholipid phosphatase
VNSAEVAELRAGVDPFPPVRTRWVLVRRLGLGAYVVALLTFSASVGIPLQRELVIAWVCGALVIASIGRSWAEIVQLALDWLPLAAILLVYDFTRGVADDIGIPVHFTTMIDFDRFLFLGETPTQWLQAHIYDPDTIHWWDVGFTVVYVSHFIVPFAVAGALWARSREAFVKFARRFVALSAAGLATYIAFPAAPPWMASERGLLPGIDRTSGRGWEVVSLHSAHSFQKGQGTVNLVAAVPSLHAAFAALVAMFLWPRVKWWWRPLLALYPLAMGLALVATGEHYAFDVLLGWLYAALIMLGVGWWESRRRAATAPEPAVP